MPVASERAGRVPANAIRKLLPYAAAARAKGVHVHHLNIGQPDMPTPLAVMRGLRSIESELEVVPYGDSRGEPELLAALLAEFARLGANLSAEHLYVTAGASEALQLVLAATCEAGDVVLTPDPTYANYTGFAAMFDVSLAPIPTHAEQGWAIPDDLTPFVQAASQSGRGRPRAILLSTPANPTGAVYDAPTLERLYAQARVHDLFLIVDEVYRGLVFNGDPLPSAMCLDDPDGRVIVLDSTSKRFSTCGFRIGAVVTRNADVLDAVMRICQTRLSTSVVAQRVVARIAELPASYAEEVRVAYERRVLLAHRALAAIPGVEAPMADGAFYQMATLPVLDAEDFVRFMLAEFTLDGETTMVSPAAGFYLDPHRGRDQIRIACVLDLEPLQRALSCLAGALLAYAAAYPDRMK